jgi:hypothetical protein
MVFAEASFLISKVSTELLADESEKLEDSLDKELLRLLELLEYDLLEQLEFVELKLELELELELEKKSMLKFDELLELKLELELEQFVAGGIKGVVRSAPQACSRMAANKNATALPIFDLKKE